LPAGAVLEPSAPSVPDELVERVIAGEVPASPAAIRRERTSERSDEHSFALGTSFVERAMRYSGTSEDFAAGIAAHIIRKWKDPEQRAWFATSIQRAAEMIEENAETKVPLLELPRTTVRRIKDAK